MEHNSLGATSELARRSSVRSALEKAAKQLPSQGPITAFVHHNPLHAFERLGFDTGAQVGGRLFGCHAYLTEERFREKLTSGRIRVEDLEAVLLEDLGDEDDRLVSVFCTRFTLRHSMLQFPLYTGTTHELRWVVAETDALRRFRPEVKAAIRADMLTDTRALLCATSSPGRERSAALQDALESFESSEHERWSEVTWEAFVLNYLWRVCCDGIEKAISLDPVPNQHSNRFVRHRDAVIQEGGEDPDQFVHEALIRFTSAFLDQGFADWILPMRDAGFYEAFLHQHAEVTAPTAWFRGLRNECQRLLLEQVSDLDSIQESLDILGVSEAEQDEFVMQSLLALRGWAGMIWQMETNAEWAPHPAPRGSLLGFLAVRLLLDRLALAQVIRDLPRPGLTPQKLRDQVQAVDPHQASNQIELRAFTVFQLAQELGWRPRDLDNLASQQWLVLVREIEAFPSLERRRIYHRAFERQYRNAALDAVMAHNQRFRSGDPITSDAGLTVSTGTESRQTPVFQLVTCIDDREESFRRHVEEICPTCETFGVAGFYGAAMYYRGLGQAHFKPLCPASIKPSHYVTEEPIYSQAKLERQRSAARRRLGWLSHQTHLRSRSIFGGMLTALAGSLAAFPLVGRVLFPRATSQLRSWLGQIVETPATELHVERIPNAVPDDYGFTVEEMAGIVEGVLRSSGLPTKWSPLVVILGHGSTSLNNPHESAYNCGACAGSQGGPNARAFAMMANDHRVRGLLCERNLPIPDSTVFVGGYHDTTNEAVTFSDLDRLPVSHRHLFEDVLEVITNARQRNAHERCRRFESAPLTLAPEDALRHVENRPEDLSQARPEYNHATNALCFVGRRAWSRGLFLDRRAFLASYDPTLDGESAKILEGILQAAVPVCAGISLEYYFSTIDVEGYGCGSKLPHNITSLLGVMAGAASDLRPGLSQQMIEIHEPMRILFVVETSPETMQKIIQRNEAIARLVTGDWVQLAVFEPETGHLYRHVRGEFILYAPHQREIPQVASSLAWYQGHREHLGFASITASTTSGQGDAA